MTWEQVRVLAPLRDAEGTIVLEEADDDTPRPPSASTVPGP